MTATATGRARRKLPLSRSPVNGYGGWAVRSLLFLRRGAS